MFPNDRCTLGIADHLPMIGYLLCLFYNHVDMKQLHELEVLYGDGYTGNHISFISTMSKISHKMVRMLELIPY